MNVLVTGAGGFIGSRVAQLLLDRGHHVHAVVRPTMPAPMFESAEGNFTVWPADLLDEGALRAAVNGSKPDAALHLAWFTEPGRYLHDKPKNLESLTAGAALLGRLTEVGCSRIVLGGTCLEGSVGPGCQPTFYAVAKRALHDLAASLNSSDTTVACCHVFSVYGPGEDRRRAVPSVVRSLLQGDPVAVSLGTELRDYLYVDDVAHALCTVVGSDVAGTFDVCSGQPRQLRAVFEEIAIATGRGDLIRWGEREARPGENFEVGGDPMALTGLGWSPSRSLHDGIAETVAWWRTQLAPAGAAPEGR